MIVKIFLYNIIFVFVNKKNGIFSSAQTHGLTVGLFLRKILNRTVFFSSFCYVKISVNSRATTQHWEWRLTAFTLYLLKKLLRYG